MLNVSFYKNFFGGVPMDLQTRLIDFAANRTVKLELACLTGNRDKIRMANRHLFKGYNICDKMGIFPLNIMEQSQALARVKILKYL